MPKHVWVCDYCSENYNSFDDANNHEKECSFNPNNKYCYTCSNHSNDGFWIYGESYTCLKSLDMDHFEEVGGCKGWE